MLLPSLRQSCPFHSLYRFSNDIDLVNPVKSQAASFCTFSSVPESCSEHPSHTTESYSTIGNIKDIYIWLSAFLLKE